MTWVRWRQRLLLRLTVIPFWRLTDRIKNRAEDLGRDPTWLEWKLIQFFDRLSVPGDLLVLKLDMREQQRWSARMNKMLAEARALLEKRQ